MTVEVNRQINFQITIGEKERDNILEVIELLNILLDKLKENGSFSIFDNYDCFLTSKTKLEEMIEQLNTMSDLFYNGYELKVE